MQVLGHLKWVVGKERGCEFGIGEVVVTGKGVGHVVAVAWYPLAVHHAVRVHEGCGKGPCYGHL
jgi:hypothetical protein